MVPRNLIELAQEFLQKPFAHEAHVAVVGDVAIDRFVFGSVDRISPEAPVPVLNVENTHDQLGCAANVVRNIASLGDVFPKLKCSLLSVVGQDSLGDLMEEKLREFSAFVSVNLERDSQRPTIIKTRFLAGSHHQLLRVDNEKTHVVSKDITSRLEQRLKSQLKQAKAIVVQDYAKGLMDKDFSQRLIAMAREQNVPVLVDPHRLSSPESYRGAWIITPNIAEAEMLSGMQLAKGSDEKIIEKAARLIQKQWGIQNVMITRGGYGLTVLDSEGKVSHMPTLAREVFDVTGAGDTLVAVLASSLAVGATLEVASLIANSAAAVVVAKVGTATVTGTEIRKSLKSLHQL
jgi:D-beta-D-heptose 7-phosphate kinase/D-beta-D-heptose 1-phosphate adenosyltransferase